MTLINTKEDIVVSGLDTLQDLIDTYKSDRKYSNDQSVREYYNKNILPKDHNTTYEDINQFRSLIVGIKYKKDIKRRQYETIEEIEHNRNPKQEKINEIIKIIVDSFNHSRLKIREKIQAKAFKGMGFKEVSNHDGLRQHLEKHGIDFEATIKHGTYLLDRKGIGSNDLIISKKKDKYNIKDNNNKINIKHITKSMFEKTVLHVDDVLRKIELVDKQVDRLQNSYDNLFIVSRLTKDHKKHIRIFNRFKYFGGFPIKNIFKLNKLNNTLDFLLSEDSDERSIVSEALSRKINLDWHIKVHRGDYAGEKFFGNFEIIGDTIHLVTTWSQPGSDKYYTVKKDDLMDDIKLGEKRFNHIKSNLLHQYLKEIEQEKK